MVLSYRKLFRQFVEKSFPVELYEDGYEEIISLDSFLAGICSNILHGFKPKLSSQQLDIKKIIDLFNTCKTKESLNYKDLLIKTVEALKSLYNFVD